MAYSILCVDDEEIILTFFKRVFEHTEYVIYTANNGVEALEKVKEYHPDIVLLDIIMPTMRGDEALPLIHEIDANIAVIVVSGRITESEARDFLAKGAFDFLQKPIDLKHLLDVVEQWRLGKELV